MLNKKIFRVVPLILSIIMLAFVVLTLVGAATLPYNDTYYGRGRTMLQLIAADDFDTDTGTALVMIILLIIWLVTHIIYNAVVACQKKDSPFLCIFPLLDSVIMVSYAMVMSITICDCCHSDYSIITVVVGFLAMFVAWLYHWFAIARTVVMTISFIKEKKAERRAKQQATAVVEAEPVE